LIARLVLWSLTDAGVTIDELRAEDLPLTPGALSETWFSDEASERFGGFAVFADAAEATVPVPERLRELIGRHPDVFELFDIAS
jgi:hypothetical protein